MNGILYISKHYQFYHTIASVVQVHALNATKTRENLEIFIL